MELASLYNELSSKVRLIILEMLVKRDARFSEIVKKVELSSPEVSRHLKRLQEANLVEKLVKGGYRLTLFGRTVMRMTSNMESLAHKSEYFLTHDTSAIPTHLLRELESLNEARIENVFAMMGALYSKVDDSEYIWDFMIQSATLETAMMDAFKVEELDLEVKFLTKPEIIKELLENVPPVDVNVQFRIIDNPGISVTVLSDVAMLALPDDKGVLDRNAYILGESPEFIDWCRRLYLYYWERAEIY